MFGRSTPPAVPPEEGKQPLTVQGIPQEFYGGANPVIHFKTSTKEVDMNALNGIPVADQKAHEQQSAAGGTNPMHPVHFFSDPKKMLLASAAVLGVAVIGAGGYYLWRVQADKAAVPVVSAPSTSTPVAVNTTPVTPVTETTPAVTEPVPTVLNAKLDTPSLLLGDTADDDRDLLTDQEESLYRSDPGVTDTDNDSYPDAHETYFLYSPVEKEPSRLLNSGAVTEYANPSFGYRMFYPTPWLVGSIDPDNRDVLFTSAGGDYIEVRVFDRPSGTGFADWLAQVAPNERLTDLMRFTTRAEEPAIARQDYLVYYFMTADKIIAMLYHPGAGQSEIAYRSTILMMARSFRAEGSLEQITVAGTLRQLGERKKSFVTTAPINLPSAPSESERPATSTATTTGAATSAIEAVTSSPTASSSSNSSTPRSEETTVPATSTVNTTTQTSTATTGTTDGTL